MRHGKTTGNTEPRVYQGYCDEPANALNDIGLSQADEAADKVGLPNQLHSRERQGSSSDERGKEESTAKKKQKQSNQKLGHSCGFLTWCPTDFPRAPLNIYIIYCGSTLTTGFFLSFIPPGVCFSFLTKKLDALGLAPDLVVLSPLARAADTGKTWLKRHPELDAVRVLVGKEN